MNTEFSFSESMSTALDFAHRLFDGSLNSQPNGSDKDGFFTRTRYDGDPNGRMSTLPLEVIAFQFQRNGYKISRLEATEVENATRTVTVYAKLPECEQEQEVVTFDMYREYLAGDELPMLTKWGIKNIRVDVGNQTFKPFEIQNPDDPREPKLWVARTT